MKGGDNVKKTVIALLVMAVVVAGCNGIPIYKIEQPPITTLDQCTDLQGKTLLEAKHILGTPRAISAKENDYRMTFRRGNVTAILVTEGVTDDAKVKSIQCFVNY